jgi:hypothetical protein
MWMAKICWLHDWVSCKPPWVELHIGIVAEAHELKVWTGVNPGRLKGAEVSSAVESDEIGEGFNWFGLSMGV